MLLQGTRVDFVIKSVLQITEKKQVLKVMPKSKLLRHTVSLGPTRALEIPRGKPHGNNVWDAKLNILALPKHVPKTSICCCKDRCSFKGRWRMQNICTRCW